MLSSIIVGYIPHDKKYQIYNIKNIFIGSFNASQVISIFYGNGDYDQDKNASKLINKFIVPDKLKLYNYNKSTFMGSIDLTIQLYCDIKSCNHKDSNYLLFLLASHIIDIISCKINDLNNEKIKYNLQKNAIQLMNDSCSYVVKLLENHNHKFDIIKNHIKKSYKIKRNLNKRFDAVSNLIAEQNNLIKQKTVENNVTATPTPTSQLGGYAFDDDSSSGLIDEILGSEKNNYSIKNSFSVSEGENIDTNVAILSDNDISSKKLYNGMDELKTHDDELNEISFGD